MFTDTISEGAFKWCYQTLLINNNQLLNYHGMSMDNTEPYSLFDLTKKEVIKRYFSYQPITLGNYVYPFSWHPMTRADKDIDVIMHYAIRYTHIQLHRLLSSQSILSK